MELRARTRHLVRPAAVAALGALLVPAFAGTATADAAKRKYPVVRSVAPMDAKLGDTIVIKGRNFRRGKNKNTVVFKRDGARAIFVKSTLGTAKQIRVVLPDSLRQFLADNETARFRVRVLSKRFSKAFTPVSKSPRITALPKPAAPAPGSKGSTGSGSNGGGTGTPAPSTPTQICTGDQDADMLPAAVENDLGLDSCKADTDGDGVPDGYEYQSARDLNDDEYQQVNTYLPYPGKRPYPNALFEDAGVDYDGDGLPLADEYRLWEKYGSRPAGGLLNDSYRLWYSDGEQYSLSTREGGTGRRTDFQDAASYPKAGEFLAWASSQGYNPVMVADVGPWYATSNREAYDIRDTNLNNNVEASEASLSDLDGDAIISDDERDEDADGLSNIDELRAAMLPAYWNECYGAIDETPYPVSYMGTDLVDPDTDGDGVRDGADDQDHDDLPNVMELSRYKASGGFADWTPRGGPCTVDAQLRNGPDTDGDGKPDWVVLHPDSDYGRVHPFNPCLPFKWARTCPDRVSFGSEFAPYDNSPWYSLQ